MCDPIAAIAAAAQTALTVAQQQQQAERQRAAYDHLAGQQRRAAALDEQRARLAEREGEAVEDAVRRDTSLALGKAQAKFAGQGSDLAGSPLDMLSDIAASGEDDALSVRYRALRNAWEHRASANRRDAEARSYEASRAWTDPTLPIARTVLSRSLLS
jgi:hypothetical protein